MSAILWTTSTHDDRRLASALRARLVRRLQESARGVSRSERVRRHAQFAEAWQGLRERDRLPLLVEFFERPRAAGASPLLDLIPAPGETDLRGMGLGEGGVLQVAASSGSTRPGDIR